MKPNRLPLGDLADSESARIAPEAGLEFAINWGKDFFYGEAFLRKRVEDQNQIQVTIVMENPQAVPLGNKPALKDDEFIGKTTSASFGYRIGSPIMVLSYLNPERLNHQDKETFQVDTLVSIIPDVF